MGFFNNLFLRAIRLYTKERQHSIEQSQLATRFWDLYTESQDELATARCERDELLKQLKVHHLYLKSLNTRADVENYLWRAYAGKEPLPDKEKCRALAQLLGIPPEFMEAHDIKPYEVLKVQPLSSERKPVLPLTRHEIFLQSKKKLNK